MRAYTHTTVSAAQWIAHLDPHLTQAAAAAAKGTDPSLVPSRQLESTRVVILQATATAAVVAVPTDAGIYRLLVVRQPTGQWLTAHITVPSGTH